MVNRVLKYRSATMVVRVVKLSLIHKIAVLPRGGQEWFLARGLLSRLETRRKLIFFVPPRYRDPWTVRANRMSTGGKGKFGKLLLDRRSVFRLLFFHGYRLRPPRKHFGTSSFSYGFSSIEEDKRKGGITRWNGHRAWTVSMRRILSELASKTSGRNGILWQ